MKIRLKITLWMMGVGCLSILIFVFFVFSELQEAYLEMVHTEARRLASQVAFELQQSQGADLFPDLQEIAKHDWVRVENSLGQMIFVSQSARTMPLPLPSRGQSITLPGRAFILAYPAGKNTVYAAWEMGTLAGEEREMQLALIGGMLLAVVFLGGSSYWVAARILQPVRTINQLAQVITAQHLNQRIPLERSRDELYELSQSLNQMFDRIENGMQQQRQFLSDASHALKTPTTMLRLFLEQLAHHQDFPAELQPRLEGQTQGLLRMERLIKQLLELSVFESQDHLPLAQLQLHSLLQSLLTDFEPLLEAHQLNLQQHLTPGICLNGHAESLRRLLICLLENAILYNQAGGSLVVASGQEGPHVWLLIQNTGPGIPATDLPHIFERFYRVDKARSRDNSGSGLGLAIVWQILRLHQGQIQVESQPGGWTSFRLSFPSQA